MKSKLRRKHLDIEDELCAFVEENYSNWNMNWLVNNLLRALKNVTVDDNSVLIKRAALSTKEMIDELPPDTP